MKHALSALILCAFAAPAVAQDDPIYAPCLQHFPVPEEFGEMDGLIAAMEDAGWTHRTWDMMRDRAAPPLAEIETLIRAYPAPFRDASAAQAYADRALYLYQPSMQFVEIFTRAGVAASVASVELEPDVISVRCTFAGLSVPDVARIFAQDQISNDEIAFTLGTIEPALPDHAIAFSVTALRFDGDEAVLTPLSGREGVMLTYDYQVPE